MRLRNISKSYIANLNHSLRRSVLWVAILFIATCSVATALPVTHYAEHSVLATGRWYKIEVTESGIHQISYSQLKSWGFSDPSRVRLYGYGGAMLPETVNEADIDDLPQVPLLHSGDRVLFYAQGPISWQYAKSKQKMVQTQNTYATVGCYFITESDEEPIAFEAAPQHANGGGERVDVYDGYSLHEQELASVSKTGRTFLGEDFRYTQSQQFAFNTPGIVNNTLNVQVSFGAKVMGGKGLLKLYHNGTKVSDDASWSIRANIDATYEFMKLITPQVNITSKDGADNFTLTYSASGVTVNARLDYILLNYKRKLQLYDGVVQFRHNTFPVGGTFVIGNYNSNCVVWDITTHCRPQIVNVAVAGSEATFSPREASREYIAFDTSASYPTPGGVGVIDNQDLHGLAIPDMVILAPRQFLKQANQVAALHESVDSMKVAVLDHELLFNEFSSGTPDAMAYRRLMKMFYDRGKADVAGKQIKYLLLFGRGFYDNRKITAEIKKYTYPTLLTFQNPNSEMETKSYLCDDVFAYLEDSVVTKNALNRMCIGVGRFPVKSTEEADIVVEKLYQYVTTPRYGEWRNQAIVVADDGNTGYHMRQAENVVSRWMADCSDLVVNKVYIEAFPEQKTSTGRTYPDAKKKMMQLLTEGQLVLHYIGHANSVGWTAEDMLNINDIRSMYLKNLPFMITTTCDFSRYDSEETSGGELFFLNEFGGAIALFSSTRVAYINENGDLSDALAEHFFKKDESGRLLPVGDAIAAAKNDLTEKHLAASDKFAADSNKLVYALLGDPAMRLGYPSYKARVAQINGKDIDSYIVLEARSNVTISGMIETPDGLPADDFYGMVLVNLYDAEKETTSFGYDDSTPVTFKERTNKLFSGRANVNGGRFTITFRMPKETSFSNQKGLISLYAYDSEGREASGACTAARIGGTSSAEQTDSIGPDIEYLYLNSSNFADGDIVNESPMLFAAIADSSGINISDAGVGHSMTVVLDNEVTYTDVSGFYTPDTTGVSGVIHYPLSGINAGAHTLTFKVWDNEGNSSSASLNFTVETGLKPEIYKVYADQNPVRTSTNFYLEHDRPDGIVTVTVTIYNLLGIPVWQSQKQGLSDMFKTFPITWNLTTSSGGRVPGGIYLYRATISTDNTHFATQSQKLCVAPSR